MLGAFSNGCFFAVPIRRRGFWRLGCLASLPLLLLCPRPTGGQTVAPSPAGTIPMVEPALPSDPTAPAVSAPNPAGTPAITLIPAPPLSPLEPPAPPRPATPTGTGTLPGVVPADPLAAPVPTAPAAPTTDSAQAATTTNIGTARRFQYLLAGTLGATFDDNIFLEPSGKRSDLYFTLQPTVVLGLGGGLAGSPQDNTVRFSYSPQVLLYVDHSELDTVQHFVSLSGSYHLPRLTLTGSQDVQILDSTDVGNPHPATAFSTTPTSGGSGGIDPVTGLPTGGGAVANTPNSNVNLDVGQRTRVNLFNTSLGANYYVSDKVSYDLGGQLSVSDYAGDLLSSSTLSGSGFFNYSPTGKTTLGLGFTVGELFSDAPNPDQTFEQFNARLSYSPSFKLVFSGQLGFELRQSDARDGTDVTPIFELSTVYSPFDGTSITLEGNRRVQASAVLGGQNYEVTGFTLGFNQRLLQKASLRLGVGYTHTDYRSEVSGLDAIPRSDDYFFVQPGVDVVLREKIVVGVFYSHRQSTSSQTVRNFNDNQVGARLSVSF